jgi:hemolysin activation/secretion protein
MASIQLKFMSTKYLLPLLLIVISSHLRAQEAPNAGALQRELDLQVERQGRPVEAAPKPAPKKRPEEVGVKNIDVSSFKFEGNALFSSADLEGVTKSWVNTKITFSELKDVIAAIQNFYSSNGRLAVATVPPQEIVKGVILIKIVEGKLGEVKINSIDGKPTRFSEASAKAYFIKDGKGRQYIEVDALERGVYLLNEVPGFSAAGAFESGSEPGLSDFVVKVADTPLFSGQAALSNYGSASTGSVQAIANLNLNNLSGLGDRVALDAIQSQGSGYVQAGYIVPIGVDGWKIGANASYLQYKTIPSWSSTPTEGSATSMGLNTSYALLRTQSATATTRLGVESRYYNNTQGALTISDYLINSINAGINANWATAQGTIFSGGLTLTQGHLNISNLTQAGQDSTGPGTAGPYTKAAFNLSANQELPWLPDTSALLSVYGQWANKNLNSAEQIYMGGPYGVRAYPVSQGGGSQGAIIAGELNHRLTQNWQIGVFGDLGLVQQYVSLYPSWQGLTNANNNYQLGDLGLSAKLNYETIAVSASLAYRIGNNPLYNNSGQQLNSDNAYRQVQAWLRASIGF